MSAPNKTAISLAAMMAGLETRLAAFDATPAYSAGDQGYWQRRAAAAEAIIAWIEQNGGRASDRFDGARISFAGITVTCTAGMIPCARNWCRKAREVRS